MKLDTNRRNDPYLHAQLTTLPRIASASLPFINLYAPAATITGIGMGACQVITEEKWLKKAMYITLVALTAINPAAATLISQSSKILDDLANLLIDVYRCDPKKALSDLSRIISTLLHIGSLLHATPELLAASLISSILTELATCYKESSNGRYIETVAALLMVAVRSRSAKPHLQDCHRNYFGKQLSQDELYSIVYEQGPDLRAALKSRYISDYIKDLDFSHHPYNDKSFQNLSFTNCNFKDASFKRGTIDHVRFDHCLFERASFIDMHIRNTSFKSAALFGAIFNSTELTNCRFSACDLTYAAFNDSSMRETIIFDSLLRATSFLGVSAKKSGIIFSDLSDTLLCGAKLQRVGCTNYNVTRPVVAFSCGLREGGDYEDGIDQIVRDHNLLVLRFDYYPQTINADKLAREVSLVAPTKKGNDLGIAKAVLKEALPGTEIEKIARRAQETMKYADGLILPGGCEDIPSELIDGSLSPHGISTTSTHRTLTELAMAMNAHESGKPTMGICLGSQVINVLNGGTLKDVDGQWGNQTLKVVPENGTYMHDKVHEIIGKNIVGSSCHNRAVDKLGTGLNVLLKKDDVVKATLSNDELFLGTQFHPENFYWATKKGTKSLEEDTSNGVTKVIQQVLKKLKAKNHPKLDYWTALFTGMLKRLKQPKPEELQAIATSNTNFYTFFCNKVLTIKNQRVKATPFFVDSN